MPTNFTVVPVEARADGGQDEAAATAEAPGAPEGREPDRPGPGERGRTCPPDKGGAGLREAGGGPRGAGAGGRARVCLPRPLPPPGAPAGAPRSAPPAAPSPPARPLPLAESAPSWAAWAPGERSAPGAGGSPPLRPRGPAPRAREAPYPGSEWGRGEVRATPGVAMGTGEGPRENPGPRAPVRPGRLAAASRLCSARHGAKGRGVR